MALSLRHKDRLPAVAEGVGCAGNKPISEVERLIADLSESGSLVFVFGVGWWTAHLVGSTQPVFRGAVGERSWHVELGDDSAKWVMDVRLDELAEVRFVREPNPFPAFAGQESLTVRFLGPSGDAPLHCYLHDLYDGHRLRQEKLDTWEALRARYGDLAIDHGTLKPLASAA